MYEINEKKGHYPIYLGAQIRAWEARWFLAGNLSYGLMQQAALRLSDAIDILLTAHQSCKTIVVWCGAGNNGGDGFLVALYLSQKYLNQKGYKVAIYAPCESSTKDALTAKAAAKESGLSFIDLDTLCRSYSSEAVCHIDALFGNGLNRRFDDDVQSIICAYNHCQGFKIAIDVPSGLHPDAGVPMPIASKVDVSLCLLGLKLGLLTGQGRHYAGKVYLLPLIPPDEKLTACASMDTSAFTLPKRKSDAHKGNFGHVLIVGGHQTMGGAVILAALSAFASGAGKVTVVCHACHHTAILSRAPMAMVRDIECLDRHEWLALLDKVDVLAFGMGLGRDEWAKSIYQTIYQSLGASTALKAVVLDADALYFLAEDDLVLSMLGNKTIIATPHSAEAGRLLQLSYTEVDADRFAALQALTVRYPMINWVLKGSGTLVATRDGRRSVCAHGNPAMASAGVGDVLAGMMASMMAYDADAFDGVDKELHQKIADCVKWHALAGDYLFGQGRTIINADQMIEAIGAVVGSAHGTPSTISA